MFEMWRSDLETAMAAKWQCRRGSIWQKEIQLKTQTALLHFLLMLGLSLLVAVRSAVLLPDIWALKAGQM